MSEEKGVRWLCHRCARKENVELETDPSLLRVCDGCQVENYTRPVKGVVVVAETVEEVGEVVVESVLEEIRENIDTTAKELGALSEETLEAEKKEEEAQAKKAEIEALKAQLAELEK